LAIFSAASLEAKREACDPLLLQYFARLSTSERRPISVRWHKHTHSRASAHTRAHTNTHQAIVNKLNQLPAAIRPRTKLINPGNDVERPVNTTGIILELFAENLAQHREQLGTTWDNRCVR
jgi:hypothetical protein